MISFSKRLKELNIDCWEDRQSFDLFFNLSKNGYLIEIKSFNESNIEKQIEKAIIQLIRYEVYQEKFYKKKSNLVYKSILLTPTSNFISSKNIKAYLPDLYLSIIKKLQIDLFFYCEAEFIYFKKNALFINELADYKIIKEN